METNALGGIIFFAIGGGLLLYSISYVVRDAVITGIPLTVSFGVFTGALSFLLISLGLYLIFQSAIERRIARA